MSPVSSAGVRPPQERLEPGDPAGTELDDRLVQDDELAVGHRVLEVGLELEAFEHDRSHLGDEDL